MIARRIVIALLMSLLGSAVFTFWLSHKFLAKPKVEAPKTNRYVALAHPLGAGEVLTQANIKMVDWPLNNKVDGAFTKPEDAVGRTLLYPLAADEPVLDRQLSAPGSGVGLAYKVPEGMRAISLKSDQVVGVAGFLLPGTHVDVLLTYHPQTDINSPSGPQSTITATVLQDVQVLAAGQQIQPAPDGKPAATDVVTLLVTPEDAERVVLATAQGSVHFVLRNGSDHAKVENDPAQVDQLEGSSPLTKVPVKAVAPTRKVADTDAKPAEQPYVVQMIYGGQEMKK